MSKTRLTRRKLLPPLLKKGDRVYHKNLMHDGMWWAGEVIDCDHYFSIIEWSHPKNLRSIEQVDCLVQVIE